MKIEDFSITIEDLFKGYKDNGDEGVIGYGGILDIRPPYQREFVYKDKQRDDVICSVLKGFPLNVMYWVDRGDGNFEVLDGQQRTLSICQYLNGDFSLEGMAFHNQPKDVQKKINDYSLMIYLCEGKDSEKLDWYRIINIAGEKLTPQELRNAIYAGTWVTDARRYFSRPRGPAEAIGGDYLSGSAIRQDYLETTIKWINGGNVDEYMSEHQHDKSAIKLWNYFQSVISWVSATFTETRTRFMKGVDWGGLYNAHGNRNDLDADSIEEEIQNLILDDDVTNKKGIYPYILDRKEKHLNIRAFSDGQKQKAFQQQNGVCLHCKKTFTIQEMEADHICPWSEGGQTILENCQMLCKACNRIKSSK
ncbi:MAG: DUF262 domain-containing protein [Gammaproteobacteria bacterium]|nr:DUF262 domain-containing protein [Gammaproteobacteria bacterium]